MKPLFRAGPEKSIPFVKQPPSVNIPLDEWTQGEWLRVRLAREPGKIGRVIWSLEGLHIGLEFPLDFHLRTLNLAADFDQWFLPGILYLLINPNGDRPLFYGKHDRCVAVTRNEEGEPSARSFYLLLATWSASSEGAPSWVRIQESGTRLLITLTPETTGFGVLTRKRRLGFNLILIRDDGQLVSWAPLTRRFSWDQPEVWGLIELKD